MSDMSKPKLLIQQTVLMIIFTMSKIICLYFCTIVPRNLFLACLRTTVVVSALYIFLNLVLFNKSFVIRLLLHEFIGVIVLADLLYYKFFEMLPSVGDLSMLRLLPSVLDSIKALFNEKYVILFADTVILLIHHLKIEDRNKAAPIGRIPAGAAAALLAFAALLDISASGLKNGSQLYNSFGIVHYHGNQIVELACQKNDAGNVYEPEIIHNNGDETDKNARYFGIAEGRNVIVIQVEALQDFVIDRLYNGQELTPNLNKLIKNDSIYFNRYYQQLGRGNTSDAEFVSQNSLYPSMDSPAYTKYENNKFMGLPMILREKGYDTKAFHGYKAEFWNRSGIYPVLGFDRFYSMYELNVDESIGWGLSDKSFFRQAAGIISSSKQPFYSFLVTLTSHHPYALPKKYSKIALYDEHQETLLGRYLNVINYTDAAIGAFIEDLKKYGLYDNSIIAVYGDHRALVCEDPANKKFMTELLGYEYDFDEALNVPLIIHIPGSNIKETNSTVGGQMDFLPTMLNLLGIRENRVRLFGQDLNNAQRGFVASQSILIKGSFIDDEKIFIMSRDGIFEHSKAWYLNTREPVDLELCRDGYDRALKEISESNYILSNNLIEKFVTAGESQTIFGRSLTAVSEFHDRLLQLINALIE